MKEIYRAGVTPQQKIVGVNQKFGNTGIQSQQGTSRILYDSFLINNTQTTFRFFEDSASRQFPLTNTGSEGNKLGVGDTMVISSVLFTLYTKVTGGNWTAVNNFVNVAAHNNLAYFNIEIANNQVVKKVLLSEGATTFNKDTTGGNNAIDLETSIVIPPLLPFAVELQLPRAVASAPVGSEYYLECQIIGVGGIIAPRTTF